jgi:hypothetical protein
MNRGYIKLFRKIEDCPLFIDNEPYCKLSAWIDLILMANHKDSSFMIGMTKYNVKRGQKWTSIGKLSERWNWGRDKVSRYLNLLENEGMIYQERTNRGLLITVVNYTFYQDFNVVTRQPIEQPIKQPIEQQANIRVDNRSNSQSHTNNNDKNDIKNDIKNDKKMKKKPAAGFVCGGKRYYEE